jgi:hypothetical protein
VESVLMIRHRLEACVSGHFVPGYHHAVPLRQKYILRVEALLKLALMGFNPWVQPPQITLR